MQDNMFTQYEPSQALHSYFHYYNEK